MIGTYRLIKNGKVVAEQKNVITTDGRRLILRFLAGEVGSWAGAIAVGSDATAAAAANTKLGLEWGRGPIVLRAADVSTNRITMRAELPIDHTGKIYELGIYPHLDNTQTEYDDRVITRFVGTTEALSGGVVNTTNFRVGTESYQLAPAANASSTATLGPIGLDLTGHSDTDTFALAYTTNDANVANIVVRLKVDSGNYYQYAIVPSVTPGYYVASWAKSAFTATGSPTWGNITSAEFVVTAKAGGATTVQLDALRLNDTDFYAEYALVSRAVLGTPQTKGPNDQLDIEYTVEFNI